jgi:hypothetical protein
MSSSSRSYFSDHSVSSFAARTSCVEIRTRLPAERTLPASTLEPAVAAPLLDVDVLALEAACRRADATRRPLILASTFEQLLGESVGEVLVLLVDGSC